MGHFRGLINDTQLHELHLKGRNYTWSNERERPNLERLDRVFVTDDWLVAFPDHDLSALSSECSDHAPLLLMTDCSLPHFKRFRFENFWPRCCGYAHVVEEVWNAPTLDPQVDAMRCIDIKLRRTAQAF